MKILIIGSIYSLLMNELIGKLNEGDREIYVLDILHKEFVLFDEDYLPMVEQKRRLSGKKSLLISRTVLFLSAYLYAIKVIFKNQFDVINIHGTHFFYFPLSGLLKKRSHKVISSIYGSEFYKAGKMKRWLLSMICKGSTYITFANELTANDFNRYYTSRFTDKIKICRFGLHHLEIISEIQLLENKSDVRRRLALPDDKLIITCGYGRSRNNQHEAIIQAILGLDPVIKDKIFLLFPMTYGNDVSQIWMVKELLAGSGIPYLIHEKFLDDKLACSYVVASDILINVPVTDQLNGAMQEMLFTGNHVINGEWLPYEILDRKGIDVLKVNKLKEIKDRIKDVFEKKVSIDTGKNRAIISNLSSWNSTLPSWIELYKGKM